MLIEERKKNTSISYYCLNNTKKNKNTLLGNLKKIQFSNKDDKNLSTNIDEYLYGK